MLIKRVALAVKLEWKIAWPMKVSKLLQMELFLVESSSLRKFYSILEKLGQTRTSTNSDSFQIYLLPKQLFLPKNLWQLTKQREILKYYSSLSRCLRLDDCHMKIVRLPDLSSTANTVSTLENVWLPIIT